MFPFRPFVLAASVLEGSSCQGFCLKKLGDVKFSLPWPCCAESSCGLSRGEAPGYLADGYSEGRGWKGWRE